MKDMSLLFDAFISGVSGVTEFWGLCQCNRISNLLESVVSLLSYRVVHTKGPQLFNNVKLLNVGIKTKGNNI